VILEDKDLEGRAGEDLKNDLDFLDDILVA
jgi:hypothetical protein